MDGKGFQVWLSAARGLTRAQRREALAVLVGPERGRGIEGRDRAWCGRGPALSALRERRGGFARYGAGSASLPVQGLRQDLQRADRYGRCRACTDQGTPLSVRPSSLATGDGEGLVGGIAAATGGAADGLFRWRHRFHGGGAERFGRRRSRGSCRERTRPILGGRARRAGTQGTAARRGEEARPFAASRCQFSWAAAKRSGTTVSAVRPGSRCARRSRLLSTRWSRRTPCWSPTAARATCTLRRRAG